MSCAVVLQWHALHAAPAMQVHCASCRGLHGSAVVQGGLRRGAHDAALLWGVVGARMVHIGERGHTIGARAANDDANHGAGTPNCFL
jgi:hypothetical protein